MTEEQITIPPDTSVADLLKQWPAAIPLFLSRQMGCVGCSMASFDSLLDVADNYHIPVGNLIQDLVQAIQAPSPRNSSGF